MDKIRVLEKRTHGKASEVYVNVEFEHKGKKFDWDIPIVYRRTGLDLSEKSDSEVEKYLLEVLESCNPDNWKAFKNDQEVYWSTKSAAVTKPFFDVLMKDFGWKSVNSDLPANNNGARRIQDLKDQGYTISTRTAMWDSKQKKNCTHHMLLPLARGGVTGYETWSPALKDRIINLYNSVDSYENRKVKKDSIIVDHKFPEIRWDVDTKRNNLEQLSDDELMNDFQLLDNQRNQQKREACRNCFQTSTRPSPFGIDYYYEGNHLWPSNVPKQGKAAEAGCQGCGWYDLQAWRDSLNISLNENL